MSFSMIMSGKSVERVGLFALLICASVSIAGATMAVCTVCGDPHWHTFDGVCYDFQGQGAYQQVMSKLVEVQSVFESCASTVSCIRSTTVELRTPSEDYLSVDIQWGAWRSVVDPLLIDGETTPLSSCAPPNGCTLSYELGTVFYDSTTNRVTVQSALTGASVVIGAFYLAVSLPINDMFVGQTYGLCGFFDNDGTNEFTALNGTLYLPSVPGGHYCGTAVNEWASTFAVDGINILPLSNKFSLMDNGHAVVPPIIIPTPAETESTIPITFDNFQHLQEIQDLCQSFDPTATLDSVAMRNCIYDALTLPNDTQLAASNHFANMAAIQLQQESSSDSSKPLSDKAIIGISVGIGLTAVLAVVIAYALNQKVKTANIELQNALIALSQDDTDPRMRL